MNKRTSESAAGRNLSCPLPGVHVIESFHAVDERGQFVKTLRSDWLKSAGVQFELREEFYSVSQRGVLRGMHFQIPPADHQKLVTCIVGTVLDVLLDVRSGPTYGQTWSLELSAANPRTLLIPRGIAHGFLSLSQGSIMLYKTDHPHSPDHDCGIAWDSFDFDWPLEGMAPLTSDRDSHHPPLADWETPFR